MVTWGKGATNLLAAGRVSDPCGMTSEPVATAATRPAVSAPPRMVGDVMTRAVIVAYPGATATDIARVLADHDIGCVPVIDEDRKVVGVVSVADLLTPAPPDQPREPWQVMTARELMSYPAITTTVTAPIAEAGVCMARRGVHSLPVVDRVGVLIGIVARSDIVRAFVRTDVADADQAQAAVARSRVSSTSRAV